METRWPLELQIMMALLQMLVMFVYTIMMGRLVIMIVITICLV
jgi:hypothetical protein